MRRPDCYFRPSARNSSAPRWRAAPPLRACVHRRRTQHKERAMTTQTTTIQSSTKGMRALIGATAATVAVLGGALLWQARPASETATPAATTSIGTSSEGVVPLGGMAEQYREQQEAAAAAA